ncbi:MAG: aldolase catalytic domain-containing protein [bacterium]|nr:aldolase catalytic domain-containing protein [bacterium]
MSTISILDCTLRDGGYITGWDFGDTTIKNMISNLVEDNLDFIECGYLNHKDYVPGSTIFKTIKQIKDFLPSDRKNTKLLAMADVTQFSPEDLTPYDGSSIDGIRVVFYKHQIKEALKLCKAIKKNGYLLFIQPMVTIDYTIQEYASLTEKLNKLAPYAVAIVDSFGYMNKNDFRKYFMILDNILAPDVYIGFHSHNNMQLAFLTAQDIFDYKTSRNLIIDGSLYGIGRGAGNLHTELITNYYNMVVKPKYNVPNILSCVGTYILPIRKTRSWGYSPYLFITALYHVHPNFACYLLEKHDLSVAEFEDYVKTIPDEMRTKCKKPYVEQLYQQFIGAEPVLANEDFDLHKIAQ